MTEKSSYELLITEEESLVLEAIAQSVVPYSLRAQALLAIDAGSSAVQAAGVAGLKDTQVRYWVGRFRNSRLQVFPEELLNDIEALVKEQKNQDSAATKSAKKKPVKKKSAKKKQAKKKQAKKIGKSRKKSSDSGKKDKKKLKAAKVKKAGKSKDQKKTKGKKTEKSATKKTKKKETAKKK